MSFTLNNLSRYQSPDTMVPHFFFSLLICINPSTRPAENRWHHKIIPILLYSFLSCLVLPRTDYMHLMLSQCLFVVISKMCFSVWLYLKTIYCTILTHRSKVSRKIKKNIDNFKCVYCSDMDLCEVCVFFSNMNFKKY